MMGVIRAVFGLSVLLWSNAAAAEFRPIEDRPYRYDTVETRISDGMVRHFRAARTIVFHRTETGYDAIVTLDAVDEETGDEVGRMFMAATGALLHQPLRYRLDIGGGIVGIDDPEAAIALIADAIERMSAQRERSGDARVLASPLRSMPLERKSAMLRSILAPVIAGPAADRTPGERPITVPSRPPLPRSTSLTGTETISRGTTGIVTIAVRAGGGIDATAPPETPGHALAAAAHAPTATIYTVRNIDSRTGLLLDARDIAETSVSDGETIHRTRIDTVITLQITRNP